MIENWDKVDTSTRWTYRYLYKILRKVGSPTLNNGKPLTREQARERVDIGIEVMLRQRELRSR